MGNLNKYSTILAHITDQLTSTLHKDRSLFVFALFLDLTNPKPFLTRNNRASSVTCTGKQRNFLMASGASVATARHFFMITIYDVKHVKAWNIISYPESSGFLDSGRSPKSRRFQTGGGRGEGGASTLKLRNFVKANHRKPKHNIWISWRFKI